MEKYIIAPPAGSQTNALGAEDRPWEEVHAKRYPGINEYLAESTGYGIVSGCEPSIDGLTVTVGDGVLHLPDGTRKEFASTSITLDAADSSQPRTDLVYIDADGNLQKKNGKLGTVATAGKNTYTVTTNFASGDVIYICGQSFTATTDTQDYKNFIVGADVATSAANLAKAINEEFTLKIKYTATVDNATITLTEKNAGNGNTPYRMVVVGSGVVSSGDYVKSRKPDIDVPIVNGVCNVAIVQMSSTKIKLEDARKILIPIDDRCEFIFPGLTGKNMQGDCTIIKTSDKVMMIDAMYDDINIRKSILMSLKKNGIDNVDYFLLTHYHVDHYGNIAPDNTDVTSLLAEPEFKNTVCYLCNPNNRSVKGNLSWVTTTYNNVVNRIKAYGNKIKVLDEDIDIWLSNTVKVELICANNKDLTDYYNTFESYGVINNENDYSVQAIVQHGFTRTMITGDAENYEIPYMLERYSDKIKPFDLYKTNHHATAMEIYSESVFRSWVYRVSPTYAVRTVHVNGEWDWANPSFDFLLAQGTKYFINIKEVRFVSNGFIIRPDHKTDQQGHLGQSRNTVVVHLWVDFSNYNDSNYDDYDGSAEKPYPSIRRATAAIANMPPDSKVKISIFPSTINSIKFCDLKQYVSVDFLDGKNTLSYYVYIYNCSRVDFNYLRCNFINMTHTKEINFTTLEVTYDSAHSASYLVYGAYNSIVNILTLNYSGKGTSGIMQDCCFGHGGVVNITFCNLSNAANGALRNEGCTISVEELNLSSVASILSTSFAIQGNPWGTYIFKSKGTITDSGNISSDTRQSQAVIIEEIFKTDHYGSTANRPTLALYGSLRPGYQYFDTTLNHLLIWKGSKWWDTVTNAIVE